MISFPDRHSTSFPLGMFLVALVVAMPLGPSLTCAQQPNVHYFHRADMPPGFVGQQQLLRSPDMPGYFQAVEVRAPEGAHVSLMCDGVFDVARPAPALAGMLVGHVYQLKITNIPFHDGAELFPTVELINRLYPPEGLNLRHPIPIELTREEMEMALGGRFVTRVIYLEDSDSAFPQRDDPRRQRYIDAGPKQDPLYLADRMGRPLAILRMGSRVPDSVGGTGAFGIGSPPVEIYQAPEEIDGRSQTPAGSARGVGLAIDRQAQSIPRVPEKQNVRTSRRVPPTSAKSNQQ